MYIADYILLSNRNFEKSHNSGVGVEVEPKNFTIGACDISKYMFSRTQSTNPAMFYTLDGGGGGGAEGGTYV